MLKSEKLKYLLFALAQFSILYFCFKFLYSRVDFSSVLDLIKGYDIKAVVFTFVLTFMHYVIRAFRLRLIFDKKFSLLDAHIVTLVSAGFNSILPAKLGELIRVSYINQILDIKLPEVFAGIFWERLMDLNYVFICILVVILSTNIPVAYSFVAAFFAIWVALLVSATKPSWVGYMVSFVPFRKIRRFILSIYRQVLMIYQKGKLGPIAGWTTLMWIQFFLQIYFILTLVGGFDIKLSDFFIICCLIALSIAIPSTPGALGVFEAAMVLSLGWVGISENEALAIALYTHVAQSLPAILTVLYVTIFLPNKLKSLKNAEVQT